MTYELDRHLSLTALGEGRYSGALDGGWSVGGGINGGFQMALAGQAISQHLESKPDPGAVSAYFLSAGTPGPAEVAVDVAEVAVTMVALPDAVNFLESVVLPVKMPLIELGRTMRQIVCQRLTPMFHEA